MSSGKDVTRTFASAPLRWRKLGLIITPDKRLPWALTHCMLPTPQLIGDGLARVYFSGRDAGNRSSIGFAVVDLRRDGALVDYSTRPVLTSGDLGCFDDNGVTPSCLVESEGEIRLYYIGWNPGSTVRMHLFGGLAISRDGGKSFDRYSRAPIIERSPVNPFLNTAPYVMRWRDEWRIYYVSGVGWRHKDLPMYNIQTGTSADGYEWRRTGQVCIDFRNADEVALARPWVSLEDGVYKMWFAHKGASYRIGYAESLDGVSWERRDDYAGIDVSPTGWDSEMIEYAAVVRDKDRHYMFYNGNNYGYDGIGLAIEE